MLDSEYALKAIAAMGLVTFALRALPFVAAQWIEHHPLVRRLGQFLPLAIMTLLLAHSALGAARSHNGHSAVGSWPTPREAPQSPAMPPTATPPTTARRDPAPIEAARSERAAA